MFDRYHRVVIAGQQRDLPIVPVSDTTSIAFLDILGDPELIDCSIRQLFANIQSPIDVILGGDTVGSVIAHHAGFIMGLPYVVARKKRTAVMPDPITENVQSIAASSPAKFWLGRQHASRLHNQNVLVLDEVCSTGSTLNALANLAQRSHAASITMAVIAVEGPPRGDVFSLIQLPVWQNGANSHDTKQPHERSKS